MDFGGLGVGHADVRESLSHTFAAGSLELFTPGGTTPVASFGLAGRTVPANGVTRIPLPLSGLPAGPYTVKVRWVDPGTGAATEVSHGIEASVGPVVDLHFPGGKLVPVGGSLPIRATMSGFYPPFSPLGTPQGPLPMYFLALGFRPGSTLFPGGVVIPLRPDSLVRASLSGGLFGTLTNNVGGSTPLTAFCAHRVQGYPQAIGIQLRHPNDPAVAGLELRAALLVVDAQGTAGASQPELVIFE